MRLNPPPLPRTGHRRHHTRIRVLRGLLAAAVTGALALVTAHTVQAGQDPAQDVRDTREATAQAASLREAAATSGRFAGVGATAEGLAQGYPDIAATEFSSITPGNEMKWESVEPTQGQYEWADADAMVDFAEANDQQFHGHTLVWHSQLPDWVENGQYEGELRDVMTDHIATEAGRYAGRIDRWDVVNEPFNEDGTLRDSVFLQEIGESYIADALRAARAADPDAKLYLNDYNIEGLGAKSDAMYDLAASLLEQGVPLDGIGLQSHLIVGQAPGTMQENIQRFVDLGLEVTITELDVRIQLPADDAELAQQAEDYAAVADACVAVEGCAGLTVWGVSDGDSWIPPTFPGYGAAHLWDESYQPKPAYDALRAALDTTLAAAQP